VSFAICLLTIKLAYAQEDGEDEYNPLHEGLDPKFWILPDSDKEIFQLKVKQRGRMEENEQEKIEKWHVHSEEQVVKYKEKLNAEFREMMRKQHCARLTSSLKQMTASSAEKAEKTGEMRIQKRAKQLAMRKAAEIKQKVIGTGEEEEELGEDANKPLDPKDAKYWLKALRMNDPGWIKQENARLRHVQRTDPNWRSKMDNSRGDGGFSWTQKTTRMGTPLEASGEDFTVAQAVDPGAAVAGDGIVGNVGLIQLGERDDSMNPVGKFPYDTNVEGSTSAESPDSSTNYPMPDGESTPNPKKLPLNAELPEIVQDNPKPSIDTSHLPKRSESPDEDDAAVLKRRAHLEQWQVAQRLNIRKTKDKLLGKLEDWKDNQQWKIKDLLAKKHFIVTCGSLRDKHTAMISEAIFNMPIEDDEKTAAETPLKAKLNEILDCERCLPPPDPAQDQENMKATHDAIVTVNAEESPGENNPQENVASADDDAKEVQELSL